MSWENRDYYRDEPMQRRSSAMGGHIVRWLLGVNVIVWLADQIFTGSMRGNAVSPFRWFNFNYPEAVQGWQVWRFFTYQFVHSLSDFLHILFNMMILMFLGPMMESWWGSRRFLAFYLLCGMVGAVLYSLLSLVPGLLDTYGGAAPLIGASGSIYGIIIGCAVLFPRQPIKMLILPYEFTVRTFCLIILGIAMLKIGFGSANAGGEAAHLGGAALGFFLVKYPGMLGFTGYFTKEERLLRQQQRYQRQRESERKALAALDAEVDRILAKVKDHGLQSLTDREKKTLATATERQRKAG